MTGKKPSTKRVVTPTNAAELAIEFLHDARTNLELAIEKRIGTDRQLCNMNTTEAALFRAIAVVGSEAVRKRLAERISEILGLRVPCPRGVSQEEGEKFDGPAGSMFFVVGNDECDYDDGDLLLYLKSTDEDQFLACKAGEDEVDFHDAGCDPVEWAHIVPVPSDVIDRLPETHPQILYRVIGSSSFLEWAGGWK